MGIGMFIERQKMRVGKKRTIKRKIKKKKERFITQLIQNKGKKKSYYLM